MTTTIKRKIALPNWVNEIESIIKTNYANNLPISLSELSKEIGVHPVHLSRQFPKYFTISFYSYIRRLKVDKAVTLLMNKDYTIGEVIKQCGFTDHSHFNRCFRKIKGINPSQFRSLNL